MKRYILYIKNISFKFSPDAQYFFKNLSASFESGQLHFIKGNNGSGKSTLFRILQAKLEPSQRLQAEIELDGSLIKFSDESIDDKSFTKQVKLVQQNVNVMLADNFTVEQNLQCANLPEYPGLCKLPESDGRVDLLEKFGIKRDQQVGLLSGGQRQILVVTMVLQRPTRLLLLDEPTAALDPKNALMIIEYLQEIARKQNLIVLIISHDDELIKNYSGGTFFLMEEESNGLRSFLEKTI